MQKEIEKSKAIVAFEEIRGPIKTIMDSYETTLGYGLQQATGLHDNSGEKETDGIRKNHFGNKASKSNGRHSLRSCKDP